MSSSDSKFLCRLCPELLTGWIWRPLLRQQRLLLPGLGTSQSRNYFCLSFLFFNSFQIRVKGKIKAWLYNVICTIPDMHGFEPGTQGSRPLPGPGNRWVQTSTPTLLLNRPEGTFNQCCSCFKGAVSRDFRPLFFFMNRTHLGPW